MNVIIKDKAIKWLEEKAYPYSKTDSEALFARDILGIIENYKKNNQLLREAISNIEQALYDADIDNLDIDEIIYNIPGGDD